MELLYLDERKSIGAYFGNEKFYPEIIIENGKIITEMEGEYPTSWFEILMYDFCSLIFLWEECYGREREHKE